LGKSEHTRKGNGEGHEGERVSIIKSLSVGNGDMYYINHNTDNFTMIDCCMSDDDQAAVVKELKSEATGKGVTRFISTHSDDDHIRGLAYLHQHMNILNFYCVKNFATKKEGCWTDDFTQYCNLRDDPSKAFYLYRGCTRKWMNEDNDERKNAGINILWPITSNSEYQQALTDAAVGESPNNISPIFTYGLKDGVTAIWMGDLETSFQEKVKNTITLPSVDVLFAPHHGRSSGKVIPEWLEQMSPNLIVIGEAPCEHLDYYAGYDTITQNSAGSVVLDCDDDCVHIYVTNSEYSVDHLDDEYMPDAYGATYIGTMKVKAAAKRKATVA
jgi:beta-lactamase superfamily II metal-dependent hydrolase